MKSMHFKPVHLLLLIVVPALTIGLISWDKQRNTGKAEQTWNDTIPAPKTKEKKARDLDDVLDELNKTDLEMNMEKLKQEITESVKKIDADKIRLEVEKALKEIDLDKIKKEVETSLAKINNEKIKKEIQEAVQEINAEKLLSEIKESMAKADWEKMRVELEKVKDINVKNLQEEIKKVQEQMKDIQPKLEKELKEAQKSIEKAKAEISEYKSFTEGLEKDGLINKKEGYSLKHKNKELFINGKKVSEEIYYKYRNFLEKHLNFSIEKTENDFHMDLD